MSQIQLNISQSRGYEVYQLNKSKEYRNLFVKLKLTLKSRYQEITKWRKQIKEAKVTIQELENKKAQLLKVNNKIFNCNALFDLKHGLSTQYSRLRVLENLVAGTEENIKGLECSMFDMVRLGDIYLSTHQKIQLLGGGIDKAREFIKTLMEMEKLSSIEDVRFIDLVMHHTEYQWNKQQSRDWIDCELWEMPVFQACMEEMIRRTHDYEEQTGRCLMTEILEENAKENGKKLVPLQTEHGVVMTLQDDIETKYERHGKVITLKNGSSVIAYKKD
ncbi:hypothetical protein [Turicibacter sanguinis]|uniref:hypothetical protein n=1 Tax=Turicibacter sanguinis TaxID=154288 RepID=UPI0018AA582D|nr:hypothetical protein [Turicibacter sanguinis]MDB8553716.1 hypothetical protein [Turicibacter sanguinis]